MNIEFLTKHSKYFCNLLSINTVNWEDGINSIIPKFSKCFVEFTNEYIKNGYTENMKINLKMYADIFTTIDMYEFDRSIFMVELEKHYQGTTNIYQLSGKDWDLYLPETRGSYVVLNILPENLHTVKTQFKLNLSITDQVKFNTWFYDFCIEDFVDKLCCFHIKELYYSSSQPIPCNLFIRLNKLRKLVFMGLYKFKLNLSVLTLLEELNFTKSCYNKNLDLTKNIKLKILYVSETFNQEIDLSQNVLLEELRFGFYYNQETDLSKNLNLKIIRFDHYYNKKIYLSNQLLLEELSFGYCFNHKIDLSNLINLRKLIIGDVFNHEIDLSNLINLRVLNIGDNFNQELDLSNLKLLKELDFGFEYNQKTNLEKQIN
jgi:hypothetical protein